MRDQINNATERSQIESSIYAGNFIKRKEGVLKYFRTPSLQIIIYLISIDFYLISVVIMVDIPCRPSLLFQQILQWLKIALRQST